MSTPFKQLGLTVRDARKLRDLTQAELAKKLDVHQPVLSNLESGRLERWSKGKLIKLANLLELDAEARVQGILEEHRKLVMSIFDDEYLVKYFWQDPTEERARKSHKTSSTPGPGTSRGNTASSLTAWWSGSTCCGVSWCTGPRRSAAS